MARVTVEDCVQRVTNRFDLVMLAAQRSRDITSGAPLRVERDNDKNPVVALREIADGVVAVGDLQDSVVRGLQKYVEMDEPEEEDPIELMAGAAMAAELGEDAYVAEPAEEEEPIDVDDAGRDDAGRDDAGGEGGGSV